MRLWRLQDPKRKKALKALGFDWGDDKLYLYFQWPEVLVSFYSVIVSVGVPFSLETSTRVFPLLWGGALLYCLVFFCCQCSQPNRQEVLFASRGVAIGICGVSDGFLKLYPTM